MNSHSFGDHVPWLGDRRWRKNKNYLVNEDCDDDEDDPKTRQSLESLPATPPPLLMLFFFFLLWYASECLLLPDESLWESWDILIKAPGPSFFLEGFLQDPGLLKAGADCPPPPEGASTRVGAGREAGSWFMIRRKPGLRPWRTLLLRVKKGG